MQAQQHLAPGRLGFRGPGDELLQRDGGLGVTLALGLHVHQHQEIVGLGVRVLLDQQRQRLLRLGVILGRHGVLREFKQDLGNLPGGQGVQIQALLQQGRGMGVMLLLAIERGQVTQQQRAGGRVILQLGQ